MKMSEENQGFTISDKRSRLDTPSGTQSAEVKFSEPSESPDAGKEQPGHIPPDFTGFILSLGTSALVHMGENGLPGQKNSATNIPQAKEIIDLLSMLEDKTKGNLTKEENGLLSNLLYTLRMKFVEIKNK
jgi:hypothetical protein